MVAYLYISDYTIERNILQKELFSHNLGNTLYFLTLAKRHIQMIQNSLLQASLRQPFLYHMCMAE